MTLPTRSLAAASRAARILAAGLIWAGTVLASAAPAGAVAREPAAPAGGASGSGAAGLDLAGSSGGLAANTATGSPHGRAAGTAIVQAGSNLLRNGGAEAGAVSRQGWDSVTIPGWQVRRGLPTVVRYGTRGFPGRAGAGQRGRGRQLLAGGAGRTARLSQRIPLRTPSGQAPPDGASFLLSGWLGGTRTSKAALEVRFFSAAGQQLGQRRLGPVGGSGSPRHHDSAWRRAAPAAAGHSLGRRRRRPGDLADQPGRPGRPGGRL